MNTNQMTLSLLVDNNPGVLSRVSGLFSRRGYNIESITAGVTQDPELTRITVVASGDNLVLEQIRKQIAKLLEQIRKQIAKLVEVRKIITMNPEQSVRRELMLVKVGVDKKEKQEAIAIANIFRAKIVDVASDSLMMEITGTINKLDAFLDLLKDFEIKEMVRTGITALSRGAYEGTIRPDDPDEVDWIINIDKC